MIKGVVKGRSLTIIGTDGDVFTSGSVGLKIKVTFDSEWDGLVKQAVFQNGSNAYISTAINDEFEVPLEVLSIPGRMLRIGIRGTNGTTLVIPTIYAECQIYEGSDKNGAAGQEWSPSEVDQVLSAVAAIDDKIGDLDDLLTTTKNSLVGAINEVYGRPIPTGVSDDLKEALLQLAQKVAYIDEDGQDYYDDLYYALYPGNLTSITATYDTTHKAMVGDTLDSLKPYLTVIAFYDDNTNREVTDYTLSGSLSNPGNNTIQVYYIEQLTATVASITIPTIAVTSISAEFAQGSAVIYNTDSLDSLREYLVVTASYSDGTSSIVSGYILSGTLTVGTSIITVSYGGQTTTFTVTVTAYDPYGIYTPTSVVRGSYIDDTGTVQTASNESGYFEDYIPVNDASWWIGYTNINIYPTTANAARANWRITEYDANKDFIKQTHYDPSLLNSRNSAIITFDPSTAYIRFGWNNSSNTHVPAFRIENPATLNNLVFESGDIDSTTGANKTNNLRIRSVGYIETNGTISVSGCPFGAGWNSIDRPQSGYFFRCYDSSDGFIGSLTDATSGDGSRPLFDADISNENLPSGATKVRMLMSLNNNSLVSFASCIANLITINGTEYLIVGS